ncbi:MAG: CYTH and CHAD domain-containing protein [Rhodospirillaceae bacterium]|nr:CYTH and CHAD domain-containing protein [Rhodospirillaceae bacterium]
MTTPAPGVACTPNAAPSDPSPASPAGPPRTRSGAIAWQRLPAAPGEIEISLAGASAVLDELWDGPDLARHARSAGRRQRLESTYHDLPDGVLKGRMATLRLRRVGRRCIQTLKSGHPADPVRRGEWEAEVPGFAYDLDAFADPAARDVLAGVDPDALQPVLSTRVVRRVKVLEIPDDPATGDGAAVIEAALDQGIIEAGGASEPISEIELELKRGDPAALFTLALALVAAGPLRVETLSKAARGWALADDAPPAWSKAEKTAVRAKASVGEAFAVILVDCVRHWVANQAAAADGRHPEGVHQMRVALRRLRSTVQVFRGVLAPERFATLAADAKWLADELGDARDWDVFDEELLAPVRAGLGDDADLAQLSRHVERFRSAGGERARAAIASGRAARLLVELWHWIEQAGWRAEADGEQRAVLDGRIVGFADRLLDAAHRRAMKAGKGFRTLSPAGRHKVRIRMKRLRYLSEFFAELYPAKRAKGYLRAMETLQEALGHLNDVAVAQTRLAELAAADPATARAAGLVLGWHGRGAADVDSDLVKSWQQFAETSPFWHTDR